MASWSTYAGVAWAATLSLAACGARTAPGEWPLEASSGNAALGGNGVLGGSPSVSSAGRGGDKASAGSSFGGGGGASHGGSAGSPVGVSGGEPGVAGSAGEESVAGAGGAAPLLATFEPLGPDSFATAISADGRVVVGGFGKDKTQAFRYTEQTRLVGLGFLSGGGYAYSAAAATNSDGSLVVGSSMYNPPGTGEGLQRGFREPVPGSLQPLGSLAGWSSYFATGVSADGALVVGFATTGGSIVRQAFRWTESAGLEHLGDFAVDGVSADGKVVVGYRISESVGHFETAVRWTSDGLVNLGVAGLYTEATAANADGSVVVGLRSDTDWTQDAPRIPFRWTEKLGALDLPPLLGDAYCSARATNAVGSVTVGMCSDQWGPFDGVQRATIWDENGVRSLDDVLQAAGANLQGIKLTHASGVSADGKAFCGWGTNADGKTEAWLARLP